MNETDPLDPLGWLLVWSADEHLLEAGRLRHERGGYARINGLAGGLWVCFILCIVRAAFNHAFQSVVARQGRGVLAALSKEAPGDVEKVEERLWATVGSTALMCVAFKCMVTISGSCTPLDPGACLAGWPNVPMDPTVHTYYTLEFGWYLYMMVKHSLGLGLNDGGTMGCHHLATVALIVMSYLLDTHNLGILILAMLSMSSPLLHMAKLSNMLGFRGARVRWFVAFAVVFFATRILAFPYVVVRGCILGTVAAIPSVLTCFFGIWMVNNVLLMVLVILQAVWFSSVLRIARQALTGGDEALSQAAGAHDTAQGRVPCKKPLGGGSSFDLLRAALHAGSLQHATASHKA